MLYKWKFLVDVIVVGGDFFMFMSVFLYMMRKYFEHVDGYAVLGKVMYVAEGGFILCRSKELKPIKINIFVINVNNMLWIEWRFY